ncbi:MAG: hypothetical protein R3225_08515 [Halofilum sp. (in: g-proteobacteria)]|nr:hypothetical protein [Halofilum sp. (in: g-proteobacteria)]
MTPHETTRRGIKRIPWGNPRRTSIAGMLVAAALLTSGAARGEAEIALAVQYLPEGDYESAFGVGVYRFESEGFGFYGNVALTLADRAPYYESLTVDSFGDPVTKRYQDLALFSVGITRALTENIGGYVGAGYGWAIGVARKDDPTNILASDGEYYVDDPANDESGLNVNAGLIFFTSGPVFEIGYHSFAERLYLGVGVLF